VKRNLIKKLATETLAACNKTVRFLLLQFVQIGFRGLIITTRDSPSSSYVGTVVSAVSFIHSNVI
jgi:uncharacterized membrane protein